MPANGTWCSVYTKLINVGPGKFVTVFKPRERRGEEVYIHALLSTVLDGKDQFHAPTAVPPVSIG
jgi:hypothetical protein